MKQIAEQRHLNHFPKGNELLRNGSGRFAKKVCVNAHDRCYEMYSDCPQCEII